ALRRDILVTRLRFAGRPVRRALDDQHHPLRRLAAAARLRETGSAGQETERRSSAGAIGFLLAPENNCAMPECSRLPANNPPMPPAAFTAASARCGCRVGETNWNSSAPTATSTTSAATARRWRG